MKKPKRTAGRPESVIDWGKVESYIKAQCKAVGIASMLGISVDTLYRRCKIDNKIDYTVFSEQKKSEGQELLRAKQYQTAMDGDHTMQIWLGKQYLEQRDKSDLTSGGKEINNTPPVTLVIEYRPEEEK